MLIAAAAITILVCGVGGLALGSSEIPVPVVIDALTAYDPGNTSHVIVVHSRVPRAVLAILVGLALGLAGAMMQSITRNPLADPGLFAVNAGAAAAVVTAIAVFGILDPAGYVWFAFAGAAVAAVAVYLLGTAHRSAATPARMALAGAAISVAVAAATDLVLLSNETLFFQFRYWSVGSLQGRGLDVAAMIAPFVAVGVVLSILLVRPLNAMAMGDDIARGVGSRPALTRAGAAIAVVLLAGAATAAAGPIAFVGLAAPHIVRMAVGGDHRFLLPGVLAVAPAFLLLADVLGRWIVAPAELQTGIAAAILGGPIFVALVRSRRLAAL
nr:iron chelate uptake ABC transporter family permease subunit [Microbacterium thalassium]